MPYGGAVRISPSFPTSLPSLPPPYLPSLLPSLVVLPRGQAHPWLTRVGDVSAVVPETDVPAGTIPVTEQEIFAAVTPLLNLKCITNIKVPQRGVMRMHVCMKGVGAGVVRLGEVSCTAVV
jgi:hypothetical protein